MAKTVNFGASLTALLERKDGGGDLSDIWHLTMVERLSTSSSVSTIFKFLTLTARAAAAITDCLVRMYLYSVEARAAMPVAWLMMLLEYCKLELLLKCWRKLWAVLAASFPCNTLSTSISHCLNYSTDTELSVYSTSCSEWIGTTWLNLEARRIQTEATSWSRVFLVFTLERNLSR